MSDGCVQRIWDNGDTYSCGLKIVRGGYCEEHLPLAIVHAKQQRKDTMEKFEAAQAWLDELTKDPTVGPDTASKALFWDPLKPFAAKP